MVTITPVNHTFIGVTSDDAGILKELDDYFQFDVPGSVHMKRNARFKGWNGKIRLFKRGQLYRGLLPRLLTFCEEQGYPVDNHVKAPISLPIPIPTVDGKPLRDYQETGVKIAMAQHRCILQSPTASGKSLVIYLIQQMLNLPVLVLVPTIGLVSQMKNDFIEYGCDPADIQTILGGKSKTISQRIVISTWQSVFTQDPEYFQQFGVVIVDEVHLAKGKSLTHIMELCTRTRFRFGFTGTLNDTQVHRLILEGLFGTVYKIASTADLIQKQHVSDIHVKLCVLHYPEDVKKQLHRCTYQDEVDFLVQYAPRNQFVTEIVKRLTGNTLVLFQLVERHGRQLRDIIQEQLGSDRPVYYIDGSVDADDRERIQRQMEQETNAILLASYGTTQLGISIKNLHNLVFAHPAKGSIRVLQSIGRILRLHASKSTATLYDLVDDLRVKKHQNHLFKHGAGRVEYYATEQFPSSMTEVDLSKFAILYHPKGN